MQKTEPAGGVAGRVEAHVGVRDDLDAVVRVMWGTGEERGLGRVVAVCDAPTFVLEMDNGEKIHWRQDLCRGVLPKAEIDYWKARALSAERSNPQPEGRKS